MNNNRTCEDERHHAPLYSVLEALGEEFHELGHFAEQVQAWLGPAFVQLADNPDCHRGVQSLDMLTQRLAALSGYMRSLCRLLPQEWQVNTHQALSNITLSDLQYRLKGISKPPEPDNQSGEVELF
jgi:hypothetical protein